MKYWFGESKTEKANNKLKSVRIHENLNIQMFTNLACIGQKQKQTAQLKDGKKGRSLNDRQLRRSSFAAMCSCLFVRCRFTRYFPKAVFGKCKMQVSLFSASRMFLAFAFFFCELDWWEISKISAYKLVVHSLVRLLSEREKMRFVQLLTFSSSFRT